MTLRILLLISLFALSGCRNACQNLCKEMYDYAGECGCQPSKEELKECYDAESTSEVPKSTRLSCRDNIDNIRDEWTCETLCEYFDGKNKQNTDTSEADLSW